MLKNDFNPRPKCPSQNIPKHVLAWDETYWL